MQYYTYRSFAETKNALQCMESARRANATVLLCAVPDDREVRETLAEVGKKALVLLMEEYMSIENTYFIGGNPYRDGYHLAQFYLERHSKAQVFGMPYSANAPRVLRCKSVSVFAKR